MKAETKLIRLLLEIGYLASGYGFSEEANTIINSVQGVRPDSCYPRIARAVCRMNEGCPQEAVDILRPCCAGDLPENELARSFLGLALRQTGLNSESEEVLSGVLSSCEDPTALQMARAILGEIRGNG